MAYEREIRTAKTTARQSGEGRRGKKCGLNIHIILVDDDQSHVESMALLLVGCGFKVSAFTSATEALASLEARIAPFHVLVTDLVMPGMDGSRFVEAVREAGFNVPVFVLSGADIKQGAAQILDDMGCYFIEKPLCDFDWFRDEILRTYIRHLVVSNHSTKPPLKPHFSFRDGLRQLNALLRLPINDTSASQTLSKPPENKAKGSLHPSNQKGKRNNTETPETRKSLISKHSVFQRYSAVL